MKKPATISDEQLEALKQEICDCHSLMGPLNPDQVRKGGATRLLWVTGKLAPGVQPDAELLKKTLEEAGEWGSREYARWHSQLVIKKLSTG